MALSVILLCLCMTNVIQGSHHRDYKDKDKIGTNNDKIATNNDKIATNNDKIATNNDKISTNKGTNKDNWDEIAKKTNAFSIGFQRRLSRAMTGDYNTIFSPFSIFTAFSAICLGANGKTKKQMVRSLNWGDNDDFLKSMRPLYRNISSNDDDNTQLLLANGAWMNKEADMMETYVKQLEKYFDIEVKTIGIPSKTEEEINDWVEEKTKGTIPDLLPSGSIDGMTRLVLVNAVYFKGKWASEFKKSRTVVNKFCLIESNDNCVYDNVKSDDKDDKRKVRVSYMTKEDDFPIFYGEDVSLLEMPYTGGSFSMIFVLPHTKSYINKIERKMKTKLLYDLIGNLREQRILVQIPKFEVKQTINLDGHLLHMRDLFDQNRADLSGINGKKDLYASTAIHKAMVKVDETGTVASAVTGIVINSRSMQPKFILNRPFLFYIIHRPSKAILFSGKIMNPNN